MILPTCVTGVTCMITAAVLKAARAGGRDRVHLGGKTILYLIDGLYAAPHQNQRPARWQSPPFDGHWTASVFAWQDPVAIESVAVDFFAAEATATPMVGAVDNCLHEAALAYQSPSGIRYAPAGDGRPLGGLGDHEHWDNPHDRQYSRNRAPPPASNC